MQKEIEIHLDGTWLFRGVTSARYGLVPTIGRARGGTSFLPQEQEIFAQFRRESIPMLSSRPVDMWEWLALAQHYGIPTRLLDWSESPYVSLFFAIWGNDDEDAGIYIAPRPLEARDLGADPFAVKEVAFFYPGYVTPRLVSQRGLFTIHPDPEATYRPPGITQIIIDKATKMDFRRKLDTLGFHHASIFPDLDGLSRRLVALQGFRLMPRPPFQGPPGGDGTPSRVQRVSTETEIPKTKINPRDPQKGQWGLLPRRNGWALTAKVREIEQDWYQTNLLLTSETEKKLTGKVVFYLHDSFKNPIRKISPKDGKAELKTWSYGAFTVGAMIEQDGTTLELDLAELEGAPKRFREQ
ncbi:FRG domain-containing protein [Methylobacterium terrae]|uniref:FRG domain-containing protein n=1 Tax=Methylobacterium terrae TaxID=2202827 RepID=UPI001FE0C882|nr:FRG domain-containing protein [Methylobacterium terrae]